MRGFLSWRGAPQRFDPVSARSLYPLIVCAGVGALGYALVRTVGEVDSITDPFFALTALFFVIAATVLLIVVTDPVNTPVRFLGFGMVIVAANLASVAASLGAWGAPGHFWQNWGPLVIGVFILAFSEFRPGRDLALATVVSCFAVGSMAGLQSALAPSDGVLPFSSSIIAVIPVVLFGAGAAVFSYRMSLGLSRVAETAAREQSGLTRRVRIRLRELLRESGREALSVELVPFLEGVLERGEVTDADTERARRISARLRSVIISDMGLPWLERLARAHPGDLVVHDDTALADRFTMEQKVALRALLAALLAARAEQLGSAQGEAVGAPSRAAATALEPPHVRVNGVGSHRSVFLRAPFEGGDTAVRSQFGTAIAVMNSVFGRANVTVGGGELRMLFAYEPESSIPS